MSELHIPSDAQAGLEYLTEKAKGIAELEYLATKLKALKGDRRDEAYVRVQIAFASAADKAGRLTIEEYILFAGYPVEGLHSERWLAGNFDDELGRFGSSSMKSKKSTGCRRTSTG